MVRQQHPGLYSLYGVPERAKQNKDYAPCVRTGLRILQYTPLGWIIQQEMPFLPFSTFDSIFSCKNGPGRRCGGLRPLAGRCVLYSGARPVRSYRYSSPNRCLLLVESALERSASPVAAGWNQDASQRKGRKASYESAKNTAEMVAGPLGQRLLLAHRGGLASVGQQS